MGHASSRKGGPGRGSGFIILRNGLEDHFRDGRIGPIDGLVFLRLMMLVQVEGYPDLGAVWTSARDLSARVIPGLTERVIQGALRRLEAGRYVRRWRESGSRGTYPVTVHKWQFGTQAAPVNAWALTAWDAVEADIGTHSDGRNSPVNSNRNSPVNSNGNSKLSSNGTHAYDASRYERLPYGSSSSSSGTHAGSNQELEPELEPELGEEHRPKDLENSEGRKEDDGGAEPPFPNHEEVPDGKPLLLAWAASLARQGLPADAWGQRRRQTLALKAGRTAAALEVAVDDPRWLPAMAAALGDDYLRARGFPFELFLSQAARFLRSAPTAAGQGQASDRRSRMAEALRRADTRSESKP